MKLIKYHPVEGKPITQYGSLDATISSIARRFHKVRVDYITLRPGGALGRHPAAADQWFLVIAGNGEASGDDGRFLPIAAGTAAFWHAGESHETRAGANGLAALVIEGEFKE